ncbi:MAG: response regulator transcription factor [Chitinophagaceae bacterium]|nr:response regulator transcription factor [Chitinophagaceae bacterium]
MIKCIAIDDEPLALQLIKLYADRIPFLNLLATFTDAIKAAEYIKGHDVDLLLLDIQMPDITGMQLLKSLPVKPMAIFTTAYTQYAAEGFELDAIDYIIKPFVFERFEKAILKAKEYFEYKQNAAAKAEENIFVRSEYKIIKIPLSQINYIESLDDYIKIYTVDKKPVLTLMSMKAIYEKLPQQKFIRVHRSFIVSIDKIESTRARKVSLPGIEIPIGDTYVEAVKKIMNS